MKHFVWSKMQAEGGQNLAAILDIKNAEREAGTGLFWWGIGNSLGPVVREIAIKEGGTLPILFSMMRTAPQKRDSNPEQVCTWKSWLDSAGVVHNIPNHILTCSRGHETKKSHYALVCHSSKPIALSSQLFDPRRCLTHLGKIPGGSQVTALLQGELDGDHSAGAYSFGFRATLVEPWFVKLVNPQPLSLTQREMQTAWKKGGDWKQFLGQLKAD